MKTLFVEHAISTGVYILIYIYDIIYTMQGRKKSIYGMEKVWFNSECALVDIGVFLFVTGTCT